MAQKLLIDGANFAATAKYLVADGAAPTVQDAEELLRANLHRAYGNQETVAVDAAIVYRGVYCLPSPLSEDEVVLTLYCFLEEKRGASQEWHVPL